MADMEIPVSLAVGSPCPRQLNPPEEEVCVEGSSCDLDERWGALDPADEERPTLGTGTCQEPDMEPSREAGEWSVCDLEERHVQCSDRRLCFDPVEATSVDDPAAQNRDGACLTAQPILSTIEQHNLSLSVGASVLYQLIGTTEVILDVGVTGACDGDHEITLLVAQQDADDQWVVRDFNTQTPDQECPSINFELERGILTYLLVRRGDFDGEVEADPTIDLTVNIELLAPDQDQDGVPDEFDCEPNNPEIPGDEEIIGNMLDDDCSPFTPDQPIAEGEPCNRAEQGLGCEEPLFCLQGEVDGIGECGNFPDFPVELELNDRCDVYEIETQCLPLEQLCFDGAIRGFEGLSDLDSAQSASIGDGDGICVQLIDVFEPMGTVPVDIQASHMLTTQFFLFEPSTVIFSLDPLPGEGCPLTPEIKVFTLDIDDFGLFTPVYYGGADSSSADPDHCAQITIPEISDEFIILVNEADADSSISGTVNWSITPFMP